MMISHIDAHIDDPDVVVRVHQGGKLCGAFVTLTIDQIAFFIEPTYADIPVQLEKIERLGRLIVEKVMEARAAGMGGTGPVAA
jgi:hypothetical protein